MNEVPIDNIEEYMYALGICNVRLKDMASMQHFALTSDWLEPDESEQVVIVKYHIVQAFAAIRSLCEMIGERITIDIDATQKQLALKLKKKGRKREVRSIPQDL